MIDFNKFITISTVFMPWGQNAIVAKYSEDFADTRLRGYQVTIVADTKNCNDERLTTMICRFPRCILSEVNTHRVFSRNSASSRARSVKTTIRQVVEEPYIPLFCYNHKGMQGDLITDEKDLKIATNSWLNARNSAVESALHMLVGGKTPVSVENWEQTVESYYDNVYTLDKQERSDEFMDAPNVHKQTTNRLIEPFMWHEALITSSYWDNFYRLRTAEGAQLEIQALAWLMKAAQNASMPVKTWVHAPFVSVDGLPFPCKWEKLDELLMDSASECARISYKDRSKLKKSENHDLASKLLKNGHLSPLEHQALDYKAWEQLSIGENPIIPEYYTTDDHNLSGNLSHGWVQHRHIRSKE